jgi:hypothetical protein
MATYKVIQDIEAEDKLLWRLSFRQFVYALIAFFMLYISYVGYSKGAPYILIMTAPVMAFTGFLAFPFGKDQPTEVWALAKLRFLFKPRRRIWAQSGVKELVTINVPKRIEITRTDGLSQHEVKSRLQVLANTIDSRGWAIKNASGVYQSPLSSAGTDDRLISTSSLARAVPDYNVPDSDDILDVESNPLAHQMDQLLTEKNSMRRQELLESLGKIQSSAQDSATVTDIADQTPAKQSLPTPQNNLVSDPVPSSVDAPDDNNLSTALKGLNQTQHIQLNNMRMLNPEAEKTVAPVADLPQTNQTNTAAQDTDSQTSTQSTDPVILNLSKRNDLNVTVIAREADKAQARKQAADGEVLISLR